MPTDITTITFRDCETEKRALRFLVGQYWGTVLGSLGHMPRKFIVPDTALVPLRKAGIPFTSGGHSTFAVRMEKLQGVDLVFNEGRSVPAAGLDKVSTRSFVLSMFEGRGELRIHESEPRNWPELLKRRNLFPQSCPNELRAL